MKYFSYLYLIFCVFVVSCTNSFEKKVETSILNQMSIYPESHLQDLYKNFFQDRFGPGHLIPDSTMAGEYLRNELHSYVQINNYPLVELIGWEGNFYRVSTDILKMEIIPYSVYLDAFVESANTTTETSTEEWKTEWNKILTVIEKMKLDIPDYEADKIKIQEHIDAGKSAMHHSKAFEEAYQPHYRIIKKEVYLKQIKPLLP